MDGLHSLGAEIGFDWGTVLQAGGGLAQSGISQYEQDEAKKKLSADETKNLNASIAADIAAANATARSEVSSKLKGPTAEVDLTAMQLALAAQDRAGAALSPDATSKRAAAADKALNDAVARAQAKPADPTLAALVRAWTATANKAHSGAIASSDQKSKPSQESWLTKKVVGPVPGYGVLAIGTGVLGAAALLVKKLFFR